MNETLTRHDRRRERTRTQLQDAMLDLVLERGYEEFVIQDITDRADVGRGTFYFHFENKEEILWSIVEDRFPLQWNTAATLFDGQIPDRPEFYSYVDRLRQFEKLKRVFLAVMGSKGSQVVASRVRQALVAEANREIEQDNYYQEIGQPAEITAQIVVGLLTSLATWWLEHSIPFSAVQIGGILYQTLHHQEPPGGSWQGGSPG